MELQQIANFLNGRYLINNMKADKSSLLKGTLLSTYSVGSLGSSNVEKIYFDTNDFFFAEKGINIYTSLVNNSIKELVIRYDSEQVTRIEFLKNIPNFFKIKINKDDSINKYFAQINEAIYKVYPTGLNVDVEEYLRQSKPQIKINKKRDSYRAVNNSGLKMTFCFDVCEYVKVGTRSKFSQPTLDIICDHYKQKDDFKAFLREVILDSPKLIKIDSNELTVARKNL